MFGRLARHALSPIQAEGHAAAAATRHPPPPGSAILVTDEISHGLW